MRSLVILTMALMLLAGCASEPGPAAGPDGMVGKAPLQPSRQNVTLLALDFVATMGVASFAEFDVPQDDTVEAVPVWFWFEMNQGVWQNLTLAGLPPECLEHTVFKGLLVGLGTNNGSGGSACLLEPGHHRLEWILGTGAVRGVLTVTAELAA